MGAGVRPIGTVEERSEPQTCQAKLAIQYRQPLIVVAIVEDLGVGHEIPDGRRCLVGLDHPIRRRSAVDASGLAALQPAGFETINIGTQSPLTVVVKLLWLATDLARVTPGDADPEPAYLSFVDFRSSSSSLLDGLGRLPRRRLKATRLRVELIPGMGSASITLARRSA